MRIPFTNINIGGGQPALVQNARKVPAQPSIDVSSVSFPVGSGSRVSEPYGSSLLSFVADELAVIKADFDPRYLEVLEHLAKWNGDLSQAVENIVMLGNTPFTIQFDDSVSDEQSKLMLSSIKERSKTWYKGGLNSLRNDLMAQIALMGSLSSEVVVNEQADGVKDVVLVHPKGIEFIYDRATGNYDAYQRQSNAKVLNGIPGLVKLNPFTYHYYALRRYNEKPYAIPPFLAALENIMIEKDMIANFKAIVKKLGLFGFLSVLIKVPTKAGNESQQQYEIRATKALNDAVKEAEKGLSSGYMIGFKDQHEIEMKATTTSAANAVELMQMNTILKMSGLKQDPSLLGRAFSTTETMGRVILAKFGAQVSSVQRLVDSYLEHAIYIDLWLQGYKLKTVTVESSAPLVGDESREQTAFGLKIKNYNELYEQGVISQTDRAQALGWEKADEEEPRTRPSSLVTLEQSAANAANTDAAAKKALEDDATNPKTTAANALTGSFALRSKASAVEYALGADLPVFDYTTEHNHSSFDEMLESLSAEKPGDLVNQYLFGYFTNTSATYRKAVRKMTKKIGTEVSAMGNGASLQQVTDKVISLLFTNWKTTFTSKQKDVIQTWVTSSYKAFRKDLSMFGGATTIEVGNVVKKVPEAVFGLRDRRTVDFYKKNDTLYLGKFITDPDTKKKISSYIKEQYLENGLPIGDNKAALAKFQEGFSNVLVGEEWKIQRILSTTVNRMRNFASVGYLAQAEVDTFRIVGIRDRLQCSHCAEMQGKEFKVTTALNRIDKLVQGEPSAIKADQPFLTSKLKSEEIKDKTTEQLQDLGLDVPPYHCNCRDTTIAVL